MAGRRPSLPESKEETQGSQPQGDVPHQCSKCQNPKPQRTRQDPAGRSHLAKVTQVRRGRTAAHGVMEELAKCGRGCLPVGITQAGGRVGPVACVGVRGETVIGPLMRHALDFA